MSVQKDRHIFERIGEIPKEDLLEYQAALHKIDPEAQDTEPYRAAVAAAFRVGFIDVKGIMASIKKPKPAVYGWLRGVSAPKDRMTRIRLLQQIQSSVRSRLHKLT